MDRDCQHTGPNRPHRKARKWRNPGDLRFRLNSSKRYFSASLRPLSFKLSGIIVYCSSNRVLKFQKNLASESRIKVGLSCSKTLTHKGQYIGMVETGEDGDFIGKLFAWLTTLGLL